MHPKTPPLIINQRKLIVYFHTFQLVMLSVVLLEKVDDIAFSTNLQSVTYFPPRGFFLYLGDKKTSRTHVRDVLNKPSGEIARAKDHDGLNVFARPSSQYNWRRVRQRDDNNEVPPRGIAETAWRERIAFAARESRYRAHIFSISPSVGAPRSPRLWAAMRMSASEHSMFW